MWTVVVPLKPPQVGKSRLRPADGTAPRRLVAHESIVLAFARDTLAAVTRAPEVAVVLLVCDRATADAVLAGLDAGPAPIEVVLDDPPAGLNAAVLAGEAAARAARPGDGVAALSADLPCLTPAALSDALSQAAAHPRAFVPDRPGEGTTMLCAGPGESLRPQFGIGSAAAHAASGAVALDAAADLRIDVDTIEDLLAALALGVGAATARLDLVHLDGGT
ncbi:MAG: cofC [Pseudonocardiales bacterium]|nr:cofC [Pseudonocardiales bacterium]